MSRKLLLLNSAAGTAHYVVSIAIAFVMAPILVHHLGEAKYGFWELVLGLVGYLGILDLGISPAIARYVAVSVGAGDRSALQRTIRTGIMALTTAGAIGAILILATSVRPDFVFGDGTRAFEASKLVIYLAAPLFLLGLCRTALAATLMGLQQHYFLNAFRIVVGLAAAAAMYAGLKWSSVDGLVVMIAVSLVTALFEVIAFALRVTQRCGIAVLFAWKANWAECRSLMQFGAKSLGLMASYSFVRQGALFALSHGLGPAAVTRYVFATRLVDYGQSLAGAIGYPFTAYFATALGRDGVRGIASEWHVITRALQFVLIGIVMGIVWLGEAFLARWMGSSIAEAARVPLLLLSAAFLVQAVTTNANRVLVSMNRHGPAAVFALCGSAACVLAAVLLVEPFGIAGVALAVATFMAAQAVAEFVLACRALEVGAARHLVDTAARYGLPLVLGSGAFWLARQAGVASGYGEIVAHAVLGGATYTACCIVTALDRDERRALVAKLRAGVSLPRTRAS